MAEDTKIMEIWFQFLIGRLRTSKDVSTLDDTLDELQVSIPHR